MKLLFMGKLQVKFFDVVILIFIIGLIVISGVLLRRGMKGDREKLLVITAPEETFIFPLKKDGSFEIRGKMGISKVSIVGGEAFFEDSPCPTKSCVFSGRISEAGDWSACLPNKIFLRIEGGISDGGLDGVSR